MRRKTLRSLVIALVLAAGLPRPGAGQQSDQKSDYVTSSAMGPEGVRREIEQWYEENTRGFRAKDLGAIMALRSDDFFTIGPDGARSDRAAMEQRTQGFLNGIDRWIALQFDIDSFQVTGDTAVAVVRQHLDRMAHRPEGVRHLETWVTQRETWLRTTRGWKLYRVDNIRDQRRLIDGEPG